MNSLRGITEFGLSISKCIECVEVSLLKIKVVTAYRSTNRCAIVLYDQKTYLNPDF